MKNTIDVLIPVYNGEKYIEKCLNSILRQTYTNLRIVIVNDGSTDNTKIILERFQKEHQNIVVIDKENTASISITRNNLLKNIESDYFTFFDSDDYAEPTYIETLYNLMQTYDADISMCGKIRHNENKKVNVKKLNKKSKIICMNKKEALCEMLSSNLYNGTVYCKLFKKELLKKADFDENIHYGEDLDFCFKIMQNCKTFVLSTAKLYHYIIRKNSIVTSKFNPNKLTCLTCYDKIISKVKDEEILLCAKSMRGLIAIELLYYVVRDKFPDKQLKKDLKLRIKSAMPFIKKNKRLLTINKLSPLIYPLTQIM